MEWLALVLLIPAIVVPVVLLLGFAGCDLVFGLEPPPETVFESGFDASLTNNSGQANQTIVQHIKPARLFKSGTRVQITVRSALNNDLLIRKLLLSRVAASGDYDSAGDLKEVITMPVFVPQGTATTLPEINYALDRFQPLLVIFDIGSPGGTRFGPIVDVDKEGRAFVGPAGEAEIPVRQPLPAYQVFDRIFIVEKIEVA